MEQYEIISCPKCQKKLRLPSNQGLLNVKCPDCQTHFFWESSKGIISDKKPEKRNSLPKIVAFSLTLLSAVALIIYLNQKSSTSPTTQSKQPKCVTVSYSNLIDPKDIIRTGQSLKSALDDSHLRNAVQPFVDSYSFLLQHAIEMTSEPDRVPHSNIIEVYPLGSAQPAWVSILRGGRIHITTDYKDHARVFVLGDDPQKSYKDNYSVIRHSLNALAPSNGASLKAEVFAYKNDYAKSELRLNLNPYAVTASSFPSKAIPLDLSGLAAFFAEAPEIQGTQLERSRGLVLYGKHGEKQTVAGTSISLSDLAVAYRAVFHAGDNEAFVSLDPHIDPTMVAVNFGGFLEDTRIGSVVLEADKRFKTITSGLDPNTFKDLRPYTRKYVASFLSVGEQDLLDTNSLSYGKWIGTRFWFYPDSISIESDLNYKYAMITNPVFMADAERSRDDFVSPEEFQRKKSATLSPSIRRNIDHLNQNYAQYANAFSELKELTTVARLMGICSWLYKANPRNLDLDVLLSVELPSFTTPREKTQLVAANFISYSKSEAVTTNYLIKNSKVTYLSPILDKKVSDHFKNSTNLAKYLCVKHGKEKANYKVYESEALQLFNTYRNVKVREIINTKKDMEALASYSADSLDVQKPPVVKNLERILKADEQSLEELKSRINQIERSVKSATNDNTYNALVDQHNKLVSQYEAVRKRYNKVLERYNLLGIQRSLGIEISGGINMEPRKFKIRTSQNNVRLKEFRGIMEKVGTKWSTINGSEKWIKNSIGSGVTEIKAKVPKIEWTPKTETASGGSIYKYIQGGSGHQYWSSIDPQSGSWRDCRRIGGDNYRERSYEPGLQKLQIAEFHSGKLDSFITGQMDDTGRIIFRRSERKDILKPQAPPIWFSGN